MKSISEVEDVDIIDTLTSKQTGLHMKIVER